MSRTLIKNGYVIRPEGDHFISNRADIAIDGNTIREIGSLKSDGFDLVIDAADQIVLPGLLNMHTHIPMKALQGLGEGLPLKEWLEDSIWPMERKMTPEDVYKASRMAIVELLYSGITCFNDMYFFIESIADAAEELGIRAVLSEAFFDWNSNDENIGAVRTIMEKYRDSEYIDVALGIHQLCDIKKETFQKLLDTFRGLADFVHIHAGETAINSESIRNDYGVSVAEHLLSFGTEGYNVLGAHCVHMGEKDARLLKNSNIYPVNNPVSNAKLASGISPVCDFLKEGISACIGTDGSASNNSLNMLEEMKVGVLVQKLKYADPTKGKVEDFFRMATVNGAKALKKEKSLGSLEVGKKADIISFPIDHSMIPAHDLLTNLLYCGSGLKARNVLINGKPVILEGELQTGDEKEIRKEFLNMTGDLVKRLKDE